MGGGTEFHGTGSEQQGDKLTPQNIGPLRGMAACARHGELSYGEWIVNEFGGPWCLKCIWTDFRAAYPGEDIPPIYGDVDTEPWA